ncbi:MAG: hypothetical protein IJ218_04600 [Alphaproteobacteria bacterium]|nr:hypothetical protein [Alphaproteobacteria bacterium]
MFAKIMRAILLLVLCAFYVLNIIDNSDDLFGAIVLNKVNFLLLIAILYLAADYIKGISTLWLIVLTGGVLLHGYLFYEDYTATQEDDEPKTHFEKCRGPNATWYSRLKDHCYY